MKSISKILIESKDIHFLPELKNKFSKFKSSKKLYKEIAEAYQKNYLENCFSSLENKKQFSHINTDLMIDNWMQITGLLTYLQNNYRDDWVVMQDIIQINLKEELMNAHLILKNNLQNS